MRAAMRRSSAAAVDIRLPAGMEAAIAAALAPMEGMRWEVPRQVDPSVTPPDAEIVRRTVAAD
jgi:hypothetical protein